MSLKVIAFKLFLVGFTLLFIGATLMILSSFVSENNVSTGIIIIGPIPIIIGAGPYSFWTVILAIVLTILCFILFLSAKRQT